MAAYYTEKEREKVFVFEGDHFTFKTRYDLSHGIEVIPNSRLNKEEQSSLLAIDISLFILYWNENHRERLNGFSGLDTVKWNIKFE